MRTVPAALFVLVVFLAVTGLTTRYSQYLEPTMYEYMIENYQEDTSAKNAVAAILLNYRMYDTMFEALILLTAIIGMKQFLPSSADSFGPQSAKDGEVVSSGKKDDSHG